MSEERRSRKKEGKKLLNLVDSVLFPFFSSLFSIYPSPFPLPKANKK